MSEDSGLIETDKLFKELAWEGAKRQWAWGGAYLWATAEELLKKQTIDRRNNAPWNQVAQEFLNSVNKGKVVIAGDRGILKHIGSEDVAVVSFAFEYQPTPTDPKKDLIVCVVNRNAENITTVPGGHSSEDAVNAISEVVYTLRVTPSEKQISAPEVPNQYFHENGMVVLEGFSH